MKIFLFGLLALFTTVPAIRAQITWVQQPSATTGEISGAAQFSFTARSSVAFANLSVIVQKVNGGNVSSRFAIVSQSIGNVISTSGNYSEGAYSVQISNLTSADAGTYFFQIGVNGVLGTPASAQVTLTVVAAFPPTISTQPVSMSVAVGSQASFSVAATGSNLSYQWRKNGTAISGATASTLTLPSVQVGDGGAYSVTVTNAGGSVTSSAATLTITPGIAPTILLQPASASVTEGEAVSFSVAASGTPLPTYQWIKDSKPIPGATGATFAILSVAISDSDKYSVVITNVAGSVTSSFASLTVNPRPPPARLSNLSVRTAMAAGQTLIVGVVVTGGARDVLVRAAGPALAGFGIGSAIGDPRLDLFSGTTLIFSNDDWPAPLAPTFSTVGAFGFPAGSKDAAIVQSLNGPYSIQCRGTGAGVVLVEAYDLGTTSSPRFVNVSARNRVGTGDDILIAGFNIAGSGSKQLLIRAVGPKLAAFGVGGVLADPRFDVFRAGVPEVVVGNDNWDAALAATFTAVGAFPLDIGSRDAALLTQLLPGSYTVQVRGVGSGTGEALVEIYEVQ